MKSMFVKEVQAYYSSLILSYLHMVLEKKSTTHKFLSFQNKNLVSHLDNFHIVNVCTHPTDKASSAIHMASSLLDFQPIVAVPRPANSTTMHGATYVQTNGQYVLCRGGIIIIVKEFVFAVFVELTLYLSQSIAGGRQGSNACTIYITATG